MIAERAYAKTNLVLHVGARRVDGLHPLCSLFASLELADEVGVEESGHDEVRCPGVEGENLAMRAIAAIREAAPGVVPPLRVTIEKRIPVAAGLGGGSADAAAVLRAANELGGVPLSPDRLREIAAGLGSDVPSQVEPGPALVGGVGDEVEAIDLPGAALVLLPAASGLAAAQVYAELDRLRDWREKLDPGPLRELAARPLPELAAAVENDLQAAVLSLRPELERRLAELLEAGALAAALSGSGPTAFGVFEDERGAEAAASTLSGGIVTRTRQRP
ncbi:MAG: 4-(cytidine 5'-diphospho)-2-C-methyl-D-erythritol kinase [Thermoleophilaceae bacterium]